MGFRLCGLAVNKNFSHDIHSLLRGLNIKINTIAKEETFDDITLNILDDNKIAIGFFGNGTLLMTGIELMTNDALLTGFSKELSIIAFYIDDITSTYCFDFYRNGKYIRKKWLSLTDKSIDSSGNFGALLYIEQSETDHEEIIFKIIGSLLGISFYEIQEDAPMLVFDIRKPISKKKAESKSFWKRLFN